MAQLREQTEDLMWRDLVDEAISGHKPPDHRRRMLAVALFLSVAAGQQPSAQDPAPGAPAPAPQFSASVDLVSLNVTVTDGTARYVTDLRQDEFQVYEDGIRQDITFFNRTNLPIALSLLIDTSAKKSTFPRPRRQPLPTIVTSHTNC